MSDLPVVYLAAPLSAPTREGIEANRAAAAKWAAWIAVTFRVAVVADWIWMTGELAETPENRALGLAADCSLVRRCDVLVMVGPRVSEGMRLESAHAKAVVDWTSPDHAELLRDLPTFRADAGVIVAMRERLFAAIGEGRG